MWTRIVVGTVCTTHHQSIRRGAVPARAAAGHNVARATQTAGIGRPSRALPITGTSKVSVVADASIIRSAISIGAVYAWAIAVWPAVAAGAPRAGLNVIQYPVIVAQAFATADTSPSWPACCVHGSRTDELARCPTEPNVADARPVAPHAVIAFSVTVAWVPVDNGKAL